MMDENGNLSLPLPIRNLDEVEKVRKEIEEEETRRLKRQREEEQKRKDEDDKLFRDMFIYSSIL